MFQTLVQFQREIYLAFAGHIKAFASDGNWQSLVAFLPMGVLFGAAHAVTPGHSKAILATYLSGSDNGIWRGVLVSLILSLTHVGTAVIIALLSLPLVSLALGSVGRAPLLEGLSRGLLGLIGMWMLWRALSQDRNLHPSHEGKFVGLMAGLIPCPLTLFVMTFAISRGVPEAGIAFAATMIVGVAITLSAVAIAAVVGRHQLLKLLNDRPTLVAVVTRSIEATAGAILVAIAFHEILLT